MTLFTAVFTITPRMFLWKNRELFIMCYYVVGHIVQQRVQMIVLTAVWSTLAVITRKKNQGKPVTN